jgi:hypothetical protein
VTDPKPLLNELTKDLAYGGYIRGAVAVMAAVAIAAGFGLDWKVALVGIAVTLVVMVLLVIFNGLAKSARNDVRILALILAYSCTAAFLVCLALMISCTFFGKPRTWRAILNDVSVPQGGLVATEPAPTVKVDTASSSTDVATTAPTLGPAVPGRPSASTTDSTSPSRPTNVRPSRPPAVAQTPRFPVRTPSSIRPKSDRTSEALSAPTAHDSTFSIRIDRPRVDVPSYTLDTPVLQNGDRVEITDAGGCVQTGGSGRTWKRYVDPSGSGSDHFYHGLIYVPGAMEHPTRIHDVLKRDLVAAGGAAGSPLNIQLGYEDDGYGDNGYYSRDPGTDDQCVNQSDAYVVIQVTRRVGEAAEHR